MAGLAIALALSLLVNGVLGWRLAGAKARCEASKAVATVRADQSVRRDETKRDTALDKVTTRTQVETRKGVAAIKEQTRERAETINRVPVGVGCAAPVGLPSLDAAVNQARAAAGD